MAEMSEFLHKKKEPFESVFDTTKKSEYLKEDQINPYDLKNAIQPPPPNYAQTKKPAVKYSTEELVTLGKVIDKILDTHVDGLNPKQGGFFNTHEDKLRDVANCVKAYDKIQREYPGFFDEMAPARRKAVEEQMVRMRELYIYCRAHFKQLEEDRIQQQKKKKPVPDKTQDKRREFYSSSDEPDMNTDSDDGNEE